MRFYNTRALFDKLHIPWSLPVLKYTYRLAGGRSKIGKTCPISLNGRISTENVNMLNRFSNDIIMFARLKEAVYKHCNIMHDRRSEQTWEHIQQGERNLEDYRHT